MASTASRNLGRISEIAQVAVRHGFGYFFETHRLTDLLPGRPKIDPDAQSPSERGRHLREMLDELGPTFVKFGQLLSTRPDVVPPDIVAELQKLQDAVTPFPYEDVERDEVRAVIADLLDSWRREATRLGESGGTFAARAASELGAASRESVGDLALRVAQLEHRVKLLERGRDT